MNDIYEGMKKIDSLIKNAMSDSEAVDELLAFLKKYLRANLVLISDKGQILYEALIGNSSVIDKISVNGDFFVEEIFNEQLLQLDEPQYNINLKGLFLKSATKIETTKYTCLLTPVCAISQRMGTLMIYKEIGRFSRMDITAVEYVITMLSLILKSINSMIGQQDKRDIDTVKSAIDTLSYSELDAVVNIFIQLDSTEGMIVASRIADKAGITRSVIVNALRKLESAGIIESRSLGMKGTFLKVNNKYLLEEINKLKG